MVTITQNKILSKRGVRLLMIYVTANVNAYCHVSLKVN